jgi:ribosomal protein L7/L12
MFVVKIIGWKEGLKKISMTKLLQKRLGINLAQAKDITDDVLYGKTIVLNINTDEDAKNLAAELYELGAIVKIEN